MAWQTIDIANPPGTEKSMAHALVADLSNGFEQFVARPVAIAAPLSPSNFISVDDPMPWPNAVPYIVKPVTGTMQVDCEANGCGTGGPGGVRPTAGFLYPRRVE